MSERTTQAHSTLYLPDWEWGCAPREIDRAFPGAVLKIAYLASPEQNGVRPAHGLELIVYGKPTATSTNWPGNAHLCFEVEDIDAEVKRLSEHGVRFKSPPQAVTWGANKGAWTVYANGPDGIALEFLQPPNYAKKCPSSTG